MSRGISVVIVDDHPLFREGLRHAVQADPRFELVGESADGHAALRLILEKKPDVALLDLNLPGLSGLVLTSQLKAKKSETKIVVLTMHKEEETFNRALDSGVMGFVLKENATQDVLTSLAVVAAGEHYLSPSISSYLIRRRNRVESLLADKPGLESLTKAERRILKLVGENKTSREIAAELFVSPRTIEAHRANIASKLNLHGSNSLLQFAIENRSAL